MLTPDTSIVPRILDMTDSPGPSAVRMGVTLSARLTWCSSRPISGGNCTTILLVPHRRITTHFTSIGNSTSGATHLCSLCPTAGATYANSATDAYRLRTLPSPHALRFPVILWLKVCSGSKLLPRHRTRAGYRGFLLPPSAQSLQDGGSVVIAISPQNPHIATTAHTTHTYTYRARQVVAGQTGQTGQPIRFHLSGLSGPAQ